MFYACPFWAMFLHWDMIQLHAAAPNLYGQFLFFRNTVVKNRNMFNYEKLDYLNFRNCNYWTANQKGCYNVNGVVLISRTAKTL
jgi:hypothetical protein